MDVDTVKAVQAPVPSGCLLVEASRRVLLGGDPGVNTGQIAEVTSLGRLRNTLVFPQINWLESCIDCCPCDPALYIIIRLTG